MAAKIWHKKRIKKKWDGNLGQNTQWDAQMSRHLTGKQTRAWIFVAGLTLPIGHAWILRGQTLPESTPIGCFARTHAGNTYLLPS